MPSLPHNELFSNGLVLFKFFNNFFCVLHWRLTEHFYENGRVMDSRTVITSRSKSCGVCSLVEEGKVQSKEFILLKKNGGAGINVVAKKVEKLSEETGFSDARMHAW